MTLTTGRLATLYRRLVAVQDFLRLQGMCISAALPLLGAGSVTPDLTGREMLGLVAAALAYHAFGFVTNDLIDLPLDRTQPLRAAYPLVKGTVRPWQAWTFALAQIPVLYLVTAWLGGDLAAYAAITAALGLGTVYNVWGKRCPFPPLTDLAQGLGWAGLALYGAAVVSGPPTGLTAVVAAFTILYIVLLNGVHGSVRDLANDLPHGVRSTAIWLGARPAGRLGVHIPPALKWYTLALQALLIAVTLVPLAANWFGYGARDLALTAAGVGALMLLTLLALAAAARSGVDPWTSFFYGTWHIVLLLTWLVALFLMYLAPPARAVLLAGYFLPLLTSQWLYNALPREG